MRFKNDEIVVRLIFVWLELNWIIAWGQASLSMGCFDVSNICIFLHSILSPFALHLGLSRRGSIIRIICDMDVYTKSCCICRKLVEKMKYLGTNEHKELRSEVGNQVEQVKTGKHELKSQIYIKRGRAGRYGSGVGRHKCTEERKALSPSCQMSRVLCRTTGTLCQTSCKWCRTTRVWCRMAQPSSNLPR